MRRTVIGLALGSAGLLACFGSWAEAQLSPPVTRVGVLLGETLSPVVPQAAPDAQVDWSTLDEKVAAPVEPASEAQTPPRVVPAKGAPKVADKDAPIGALFVSAERALRLSREASIPASRYVPAQGARPAGLQVAGVSGLGIGVRDGDVLTKVAGSEVRSSAAVVSLVLKLRARKAKAISGELWRGQQRFQIVFEMPYLQDAASAPATTTPKPSNGPPPAGTGAIAPAGPSSPSETPRPRSDSSRL